MNSLNNIQYLNDLKHWLEQEHILLSDVVLVGSASIAYAGIRENHDLEFCINPVLYNLIKDKDYYFEKRGHIEVCPNIDLFKNQYSHIGVTDKLIFRDKYYITVKEWNISLLEIEYLYKRSLRRPKDKDDVHSIEEMFPDIRESCLKYSHPLATEFCKFKELLSKGKSLLGGLWK